MSLDFRSRIMQSPVCGGRFIAPPDASVSEVVSDVAVEIGAFGLSGEQTVIDILGDGEVNVDWPSQNSSLSCISPLRYVAAASSVDLNGISSAMVRITSLPPLSPHFCCASENDCPGPKLLLDRIWTESGSAV